MATSIAPPPARVEAPVEPIAAPRGQAVPPRTESQEKPPTRLMIEEIGNTGVYVYKVLDSATGKLISQIPREEIVRLSQSETYSSGAVVNAQA